MACESAAIAIASSIRGVTSQMRNSRVPKIGVRAHVPPDFFRIVDAAQLDEQADVILVLAPRIEMVGNSGAGESAENCGAK